MITADSSDAPPRSADLRAVMLHSYRLFAGSREVAISDGLGDGRHATPLRGMCGVSRNTLLQAVTVAFLGPDAAGIAFVVGPLETRDDAYTRFLWAALARGDRARGARHMSVRIVIEEPPYVTTAVRAWTFSDVAPDSVCERLIVSRAEVPVGADADLAGSGVVDIDPAYLNDVGARLRLLAPAGDEQGSACHASCRCAVRRPGWTAEWWEHARPPAPDRTRPPALPERRPDRSRTARTLWLRRDREVLVLDGPRASAGSRR